MAAGRSGQEACQVPALFRDGKRTDYAGGDLTGRSFVSVRMGVKAVAERWTRAARSMNAEDRQYALRIVDMAKKHSSEAFYALDDPLEAACLSVLVEILKEQERAQERLQVQGQEPGQGLPSQGRSRLKEQAQEPIQEQLQVPVQEPGQGQDPERGRLQPLVLEEEPEQVAAQESSQEQDPEPGRLQPLVLEEEPEQVPAQESSQEQDPEPGRLKAQIMEQEPEQERPDVDH